MKPFKILLTVIATALLFASCEKQKNEELQIVEFSCSDCKKSSESLFKFCIDIKVAKD